MSLVDSLAALGTAGETGAAAGAALPAAAPASPAVGSSGNLMGALMKMTDGGAGQTSTAGHGLVGNILSMLGGGGKETADQKGLAEQNASPIDATAIAAQDQTAVIPHNIRSIIDKVNAMNKGTEDEQSIGTKLGHMGIKGNPAYAQAQDMTGMQGQQGYMPQLQPVVQNQQGPQLSFGSPIINQLLEAARGYIK